MATAFHVNLTAHSRSKGHSAVAGAAYRSGSELTDERTGEIHDYTRKQGIEHSEIVLPESAPDWARDRSALWNAAEAAENRKNSTIDREFKVSFPAQLSFDERREMVRQFSQEIVERHGVAVDFSMHEPDKGGDDRNYHAHVMLSTRRMDENGFTEKARELDSFSTRAEHLVHYRERWAAISGNALEKAGYSEDAARWRSGHLTLGKQVEAAESRGDWQFVKDNTDRVPQIHLGQNATQAERRGVETRLGDVNRENETARQQALVERQALADKLDRNPSLLVDRVTDRKAVFDHRDLARELHLHVDDPAKFQDIMARAQASEKIVQLAPERFENGVRTPAKYSTQQMIDLEKGLVNRAEFMSERHTHAVDPAKVEAVLASRPSMTDEQRDMVRNITSDRQFAVVVGDAGTGKSFSMHSARQIWEHSGYRVQGLALAGKAAEELQQSSGIESRTIASWELRLDKGIDKLTSKDVIVLDESGMVGSKQLDRLLTEADKAGAKVVWAGDHKQLEAINAGAGHRTVVERLHASELTQVQRQKEQWQKEASYELARGDFRAGLDAYKDKGNVHMAETREEARQMLVDRYMSERGTLNKDGKPATQAIMAHANKDVRELNQAVRGNLKERGELGEGIDLKTAKGTREFADGDRFVFLKNDKNLGVKNGSTGTVERASGDHMSVKLDTGKTVVFDPKKYNNFDHGYALTIHKEQGASVDRAYPLATPSMDRSLSYVAMTRHKEEMNLYAAREDFKNYDRLADRMARDNRKESTLDYLDKGAVKSREGAAVEQSKPKEQESSNERPLRGRHERAERAEYQPDRELLAARRGADQTGLGLHQLSSLSVARTGAENERSEARNEGVLPGAVRDSGQQHEGMHDARARDGLNAQESAQPARQDALSRALAQQEQQRTAQQAESGQDALSRALARQDQQRTTQQAEGRQDALSRAMAQQQTQQAEKPATRDGASAAGQHSGEDMAKPNDKRSQEQMQAEHDALAQAAARQQQERAAQEGQHAPERQEAERKPGAVWADQVDYAALRERELQADMAESEQANREPSTAEDDRADYAAMRERELQADMAESEQPEQQADQQPARHEAEAAEHAATEAIEREPSTAEGDQADYAALRERELQEDMAESEQPEQQAEHAATEAVEREPGTAEGDQADYAALRERELQEDMAELEQADQQPEQREGEAAEQAAAEAIEQPEQDAEQLADQQPEQREGEAAEQAAAEAVEQPEQDAEQLADQQPEQREGEAAEQAAAEAIEQPEQAAQQNEGEQDALSRAMAQQEAQRDAQQAEGRDDALARAMAEQEAQRDEQQAEGQDDALEKALEEQEQERDQQESGDDEADRGDDDQAQPEQDDDRER